MADQGSAITLTMRLLRKGKVLEDAFRDDYRPGEADALQERPWPEIPEARLLVGQIFNNPPPWHGFLERGSADLPELTSGGAAAIIFVPIKDRLIAVCFGHEHIPLNLDAFERQFGLRVTLNTVPRGGIRTLDLATPDAVTFQRRVQASRDSDIGEFGVDIFRDLARVAGGTPKDKTFASFVAGKDSLSITCKLTPTGLLLKCQEVLQAFNAKAYKSDFGWIDNLSRVASKDDIDRADAELGKAIDDLMNGVDADLHMAPPEIVDYTEGSVLHYNGFGSNGVNFHRLAIEDYVAELVRCKFKGSIQDIKESHRIKAAKVGTEKLTEAWKVYDCFIFETELKEPEDRKRTFVLFAGDWYEVEKGFKNSIESFFASLEQRVVVAHTFASNEEALIVELEGSRTDLVKLDRQKINPENVRYGNLEPCDFLSDKKEFIHLKDGHSSGPISHLWMQGVVSGDAFAMDKKFRRDLRSKVKKLKPGFEKLLPDGRSEPTRADYTVVFGIMREPLKDGSLNLPFFSMVSLKTAAERLQQMGYKVAINLIEKRHAIPMEKAA
jgi:uncharacterized protein (TIGR04141 family)